MQSEMGFLKQSAWEVGEIYAGQQGVKLVSISYHALQQRLHQEPQPFARDFFHAAAAGLAERYSGWVDRYRKLCSAGSEAHGFDAPL